MTVVPSAEIAMDQSQDKSQENFCVKKCIRGHHGAGDNELLDYS